MSSILILYLRLGKRDMPLSFKSIFLRGSGSSVIGSVFILFLFGCLPEAPVQGSNVAVVKIADRQFNIPHVYIDGGQNLDVINDSVVLVYTLPNFKPEPHEVDVRKEAIISGALRGMLLENAFERPPIGLMVSNRMQGVDVFSKEPGDFYGLEKYTAPKPQGAYAHKPDDMFIERDVSGNVVSFLNCSPLGKDRVPGCRHTFTDKGVLYRIRWNLSDLKSWREQKTSAIKFIDNFEVKF